MAKGAYELTFPRESTSALSFRQIEHVPSSSRVALIRRRTWFDPVNCEVVRAPGDGKKNGIVRVRTFRDGASRMIGEREPERASPGGTAAECQMNLQGGGRVRL